MAKILINSRWPEELRIATIEQKNLIDLEIDNMSNERLKGNIYNGKILKIETSLNAVFVDYGENRNGFLPFKEIHQGYLKRNEEGKLDPSSLSIGQNIMVQVEKDERGEKGAALTTYISLAGTYLVFMPYSNKVSAISKQAESSERNELKQLLSQLNISDGVGVIVRTAGIGKSFEELKWDYESLLSHWEHIQEASQLHQHPFLIYQESDTLTRVLRDNLKQETELVVIDNQAGFDKVKRFLNFARPSLKDKVELYDQTRPIFDYYGVEDQVRTIFNRQIKLPSGGEIIIDSTEALTAIDVNSAKSTKGDDIESTAFHTNVEAIEAIASQLKLRDIGGIVIIDLIDMADKKNRTKVEDVARKAFQSDRAKIKLESISPLTGCLSLLRQRLKSSTSAVMTMKSECVFENFCLMLLRIVESCAAEQQTVMIQLQTSLNVGTYLLNEYRDVIQRIQTIHDVEIQIIPNSNYSEQKFNIKDIKSATKKHDKKSYELKTTEINEIKGKSIQKNKKQPIISDDLYKKPAPQESSLLARLMKIFQKEPVKNKKPSSQSQRRSSGPNSHGNNRSRANMAHRRRKQNPNSTRRRSTQSHHTE